MKTYAVYSKPLFLAFKNFNKFGLLRDAPEGIEPPIQVNYLNMLMGMFLRILVKVYAEDDLAETDRAKLRKYLERIFEAKDVIMCKEPKGGFYPRKNN